LLKNKEFFYIYPRGHPSAAGQAQDRISSPAKDRRSTTATPPS